ncbi:MAG: LysR family transcriptional regulator [Clostridium sp.]
MISEMKYVYAVYQEKSFSKAAKKLFISQPALSNMVKKAEKEIGTPIFDRSTIPLTVTKEGDYYIRSIEQMLQIQKNMREYFEDLGEMKQGSLSLGGSSFFCSFVFPDIIGKFRSKYPNIAIDLVEGNIKELKEGLFEGTLDLVIETAVTEAEPLVQRIFYKNENIILAVPASFPINRRFQPYRLTHQDIVSEKYLKTSVEPVPLGSFKDTPFITLKPGNDIYNRSIAMCRNRGFSMRIVMELDQIMTSMNIACNGIGALFVRADMIKYLPDDGRLIYYKLDDPLAQRTVSFVMKKGRYMTAAMREFLRLAGVRIPSQQ